MYINEAKTVKDTGKEYRLVESKFGLLFIIHRFIDFAER